MKTLANLSVVMILVFSIVLSTTGVVFYTHFCQNSAQNYVSVYVDNTQELCHEQKHEEHDSCCSSGTTADDCCTDHNDVQTFSIKLKENFIGSSRTLIPTADFHCILFCAQLCADFCISSLDESLKLSETSRLSANTSPKINYGRTISIRQHKLKLYC